MFDQLKGYLKDKADANKDGKVTVADANFLLDEAKVAAHILFWIGVCSGAALACVVGWIIR